MALFLIEAFVVWTLAVVAVVRWFFVASSDLEEEATEAAFPLSGQLVVRPNATL